MNLKVYCITFFVCCFCIQLQAQQVSFDHKGVLDLHIHYNEAGSNTTKWPNSKKGKDIFLSQDRINMTNYTGPVVAMRKMGIIKSLTIQGRWFNLLGDFATSTGVIWEYSDDFSFTHQGQRYTIKRQEIAKYPSLLKRFKSARPLALDYTLKLPVIDEMRDTYGVELKVYDIDHIVSIEGGMPYMVPMSPPRWRDRMSIGVYATADEAVVKKAWSTFTDVNDGAILTIDRLTLPIEEFVAIANLYKAYEKGDKALKDEYKMLEKDYVVAASVKPYAKADAWSQPYEQEIKSASVFKTGDGFGLRSGNKIVFESTDYYRAAELPNSSKFFFFAFKTGAGVGGEIRNAKGKKISVNNISSFGNVEAGKDPGTYILSPVRDRDAKLVYTTRRKVSPYKYREQTYSADELADIKSNDSGLSQGSGGSSGTPGTVSIGLPDAYVDFYEIEYIVTDENLRVISSRKAYFPNVRY